MLSLQCSGGGGATHRRVCVSAVVCCVCVFVCFRIFWSREESGLSRAAFDWNIQYIGLIPKAFALILLKAPLSLCSWIMEFEIQNVSIPTVGRIALPDGRELVAQTVRINDVLILDKVRFNTNNIWTDGKQPSDYLHICRQTETPMWIDSFKTYKKIVLNLRSAALSWMKDAFHIGSQSGTFPKQFEDELDLISGLEREFSEIFDGTDYFVRTEKVSLKEGQHGVGPYTSLKMIIESCVTCRLHHTPIKADTDEIELFLIPWQRLSRGREYRVFVNENKITAISQQHLYDVFEHSWKTEYSSDAMSILQYFDESIRARITHISSYVMDIAVLEDGSPFFIELNPFGTEYSSGSALFGWTQDHSDLYGLSPSNSVIFRYTISSSTADDEEALAT